MELEKDSKTQAGISLIHYKNPETGINDITAIYFDLRLFQKEILAANPQLSDAIANLGITQNVAPSAGGSLGTAVNNTTNGVINQNTLEQSEQMSLPQQ